MKSNLETYREWHKNVMASMKTMNDRCITEKRDFTESEAKEYADLEARLTDLDGMIEKAKLDGCRVDRDMRGNAFPSGGGGGGGTRGFRTYSHDEPFETRVQGRNFQRWLRGVCVGDWGGNERELRSMAIGSDGAYTVGAEMSPEIINLVRNQSVVLAAGARSFPMKTKTLSFAKQSGASTAYSVAENVEITASDLTFSGVTLDARKIAILTKSSRELWSDGANIAAIVSQDLTKQLALKLDSLLLTGTGAGQCTGIFNTSGINSAAVDGAGAKYDTLIDLIGDITYANHPVGDLSMICNPRELIEMAEAKDGQGLPLPAPKLFTDSVKRILPTNGIAKTGAPGGTGTTVCIGKFDECYVGFRTELEVEIDTSRYLEFYQVAVRAVMRFDMALAHADAFAVATGVQSF